MMASAEYGIALAQEALILERVDACAAQSAVDPSAHLREDSDDVGGAHHVHLRFDLRVVPVERNLAFRLTHPTGYG